MLPSFSVLVAALTARSLRLRGTNLTDAPRWDVYALRLLASSECAGDTALDVQYVDMDADGGAAEAARVNSSGVFCGNGGMMCGIVAAIAGPLRPLSSFNKPAMSTNNNEWVPGPHTWCTPTPCTAPSTRRTADLGAPCVAQVEGRRQSAVAPDRLLHAHRRRLRPALPGPCQLGAPCNRRGGARQDHTHGALSATPCTFH